MRLAEARPAPAAATGEHAPGELVICSLEAWDDVWRRNQFFVDALLRRHRSLRILFVEPATDIVYELAKRRRPALPGMRQLRPDGRLHALRPLKPLPRRLGALSDTALRRSVLNAAGRLALSHPTLWLNDVTYAPLIELTGWPTVYDITDDWLLAPFHARELARLRRLDQIALDHADEVVVCSPALAASRGATRAVTVVPNGVDREHFRRPRPRPNDLPTGPVAVYLGTLHEARLDVELIVELARALPQLSVALVGPDALAQDARRALGSTPNVYLLGERPYSDVPAYLQHADVVLVPHLITPFTESLDPIKAYECLVIDPPVVATPAAGFRELAGQIVVASRESFVAAVATALADGAGDVRGAVEPVSWAERADAFALVLEAARSGADTRTSS